MGMTYYYASESIWWRDQTLRSTGVKTQAVVKNLRQEVRQGIRHRRDGSEYCGICPDLSLLSVIESALTDLYSDLPIQTGGSPSTNVELFNVCISAVLIDPSNDAEALILGQELQRA